MGKVHVRQKGGKKAYRWAKGHSSDSNPPLKKFRKTAQAGFFQPLGEPKKGKFYYWSSTSFFVTHVQLSTIVRRSCSIYVILECLTETTYLN